MNKDLDLTQVLKDCPKGTKLYSTIYGEVKFIRIDNESIYYPIDFNTFDGYTISLTSDGRCNKSYDGECTLFPSKDLRDWSKWQRPFVDGDIIFTQLEYKWVSILKRYGNEECKTYIDLNIEKNSFYDNTQSLGSFCKISNIIEQRLATEDEKQKLFDVIREKGYKWNAEAKMMEKLPKDRFDPKTLIPFESKVLVRDGDHFSWVGSIYTHRKENGLYTVNGTYYRQCIPYNDDTAYLIGTYKEAPEYYRYWED